MKLPRPLHPTRSLGLAGCLVALFAIAAHAQTPVAERLDVNFGEPKLLPVDGTVDDYSVSPEGVVKVSKPEDTPNQLFLTGLASGSATLTVKSNGRTLIYDVAVSPAPERLYINLDESKRLTFADPIDDTSLSEPNVVRVVQPDVANNVLLLEARTAGKTTLTVYSKGQIYRYFISTFENRGADVLEIENAFSAKGYRNLTITFDKDQAVITGTVPTQEELDDAVRIVKQYTQFVQVKAQLGQDVEQSEYTEEESIIINNIQRIADVPGLTVRVKFPAPTVVTTSTYTKSTGDYIAPVMSTTPQGGTVRGAGFTPPAQSNQQVGPAGGALEAKPQQNTTETVTTTRNTTIPEKIFLYGDIQDDLQEAKIIRVARTFCPFIVNFLTVRDPIQLRTQIRFMQVNRNTSRDTGVYWSGNGPEGGPTVTIGLGNSLFNYLGNLSAAQSFTNMFTGAVGAVGNINAQAQLELYQQMNIAKLMREEELFLTNGQPGWYSEGEVRSYVSSSSVSITEPPVQTLTQAAVFLGVHMDIAPLNIAKAGGVEPSGQKVFGIPSGIGAGYTLEENTDNSADSVSRLTRKVQEAGSDIPLVDDSTKYVDENGLIGMDISTQLSIPNGTFATVQLGGGEGFITLPDFFVRTTRTRVNLRDGQSVVINGLIDEQTTRAIRSVPFLESIPIFGALFRNPVDFKSNEEVVVLVTPHIVRMRDSNSSRVPKPTYPEMIDLAREKGEVPILKPVKYDAEAVDLRPEAKDMKDNEASNTPETPSGAPTPVPDDANNPPLRPHVIGASQTLQPPVDSATAPTVSARPASTGLTPNSTLP